MTSEDLPYPTPDWLKLYNRVGDALPHDYGLPAHSEETTRQWQQNTNAVVNKYFRLFMEGGPDAALDQFGDYLEEFGPLNKQVSMLTKLLPEQFGPIANIASLGYDKLAMSERQKVLDTLCGFLYSKNSSKIPYFTRQLREAEVLRGLLLRWDIFWPALHNEATFMSRATPQDLGRELARPDNNPLMLALSTPLATTTPELRQHFQATWPETFRQGIQVTAAYLVSQGAQYDILHSKYPDRNYPTWEENIHTELEAYAGEHWPDILQQITEIDWSSLIPAPASPDPESPSSKIRSEAANLALGPDGRLFRKRDMDS